MYITVAILAILLLLVLFGYALSRRKPYPPEEREPRPDEKKGTTYLNPQAEQPKQPEDDGSRRS